MTHPFQDASLVQLIVPEKATIILVCHNKSDSSTIIDFHEIDTIFVVASSNLALRAFTDKFINLLA